MTTSTPETTPVKVEIAGGVVYVDPEDLDLLYAHRYYRMAGGYAMRTVTVTGRADRRGIYLQREILARKLGRPLVDREYCWFRDGRPANCTRDNLLSSREDRVRRVAQPMQEEAPDGSR